MKYINQSSVSLSDIFFTYVCYSTRVECQYVFVESRVFYLYSNGRVVFDVNQINFVSFSERKEYRITKFCELSYNVGLSQISFLCCVHDFSLQNSIGGPAGSRTLITTVR